MPVGLRPRRGRGHHRPAARRAAQRDGLPAGGWPVVPLSLSDIDETDCADSAAGVGGLLSDDVSRFLDAVGNANGSYDVGDFRAFLLATGAIQE